jgi:ankyrin repeat protein
MLEAVRKSDGDTLTKMLSKPGATVVNYRDPTTGEGAIHVVVRRSDATYLRFLLAHGADANLRDGKGTTPLMLAVENSFDSGIAVLVQAGASVDLANSSGETPLIRAVQNHNLTLVRDLLTAGADPDKTDVIAGRSARDYARLDGRAPDIAKVLNAIPKKVKRNLSGPMLTR